MNGEYQALMDENKTRAIIFLMTSVCVSLPALVLAFQLFHLHRKIRGRISVFILLLLLNDLIQLLLHLYILANILSEYRYYIPELVQFWLGLYWCGFHLHQLVALEGIVTLKYPLCSARIFSVPCYITVSILVLFFSTVSALFLSIPLARPLETSNKSLFSLSTSFVPLIVLSVSSTISCKASSTPVSKNICSLFIVASLTYVMMYLPFMFITWVDFFNLYPYVDPSWFIISHCLMSLRVFSGPILCGLVCRENIRDVQTPQTHTEPNADKTSV